MQSIDNSIPILSTISKGKDFRQQIHQIKLPFNLQIKKSVDKFQQRLIRDNVQHQEKEALENMELFVKENSQNRESQNSSIFQIERQFKKDHEEFEESEIQQNNNNRKTTLKEWRAENSLGNQFEDYNELIEKYGEIFKKKNVKKNSNSIDKYDFKGDQKKILVQIFQQLKVDDNLIEIDTVKAFFEKVPLYHLFYNIRPSCIDEVLRENCHTKQDYLTLKQFLTVFYLDRQSVASLQENQVFIVNKKCVLEPGDWNELKNIFETLDTFGNQRIHIRAFYKKIKFNPSNRKLIDRPAIQFPQIRRSYSLRKILFDLENRYKQTTIKMDWRQVQELISNFQHLEEPSIDILYLRQLQRAEITSQNNYFLISDEIIKDIKKIFGRCPKYCQYFVKGKYFSGELLDSDAFKKHMKSVVRSKKIKGKETIFTIEDQIRNIANSEPLFKDLDEILEHFSIKGFFFPSSNNQEDDEESSDEENYTIKSVQKITSRKKNNPKPFRTVIEEFKLSKSLPRMNRLPYRTKKEIQDELELKNKFKSSPIPAQINPQRFKKYQKKIAEKNDLRHQLQKRARQSDHEIINYMKANSKIFEKKEIKENINFISCNKTISPKPLPWFVLQNNMLNKIQKKKQFRRKKILNESKIRNIKCWKNLPEVIEPNEEQIDSFLDQINTNNILQDQQRRIRVFKEVPDFKKLHKEFDDSLKRKKQQFKTTSPIPFNFSSYHIDKRVSEGSAQKFKSSYCQKTLKQQKHKMSVKTVQQPENQIPLTKKYQSMVNLNQERLKHKNQQLFKIENQQMERKIKQKHFAKFMRKKLKYSLQKSSSMHNISHQKFKGLNKKHQIQMSKIYSRVMERPFLFENSQNSKPRLKKKGIQGFGRVILKQKKNQNYNERKFEEKQNLKVSYQSSNNKNLNQSF